MVMRAVIRNQKVIKEVYHLAKARSIMLDKKSGEYEESVNLTPEEALTNLMELDDVEKYLQTLSNEDLKMIFTISNIGKENQPLQGENPYNYYEEMFNNLNREGWGNRDTLITRISEHGVLDLYLERGSEILLIKL
jgi:hypothetical protein